jgi:hypothetical protein
LVTKATLSFLERGLSACGFSNDCSLVLADGEQSLSFEKLESRSQGRPADLETTGQLALAGKLVFPEPCSDTLTHGLSGLHDEAVALRGG